MLRGLWEATTATASGRSTQLYKAAWLADHGWKWNRVEDGKDYLHGGGKGWQDEHNPDVHAGHQLDLGEAYKHSLRLLQAHRSQWSRPHTATTIEYLGRGGRCKRAQPGALVLEGHSSRSALLQHHVKEEFWYAWRMAGSSGVARGQIHLVPRGKQKWPEQGPGRAFSLWTNEVTKHWKVCYVHGNFSLQWCGIDTEPVPRDR